MGGRGASSGTSKAGNKYGTQYHTLYQSGNIKFVTKNERTSETLMETMTEGRVYAVIGGNEVKSIVYFDSDNKRSKQIDLDHKHNQTSPHVHRGYEHSEYDPTESRLKLSSKEQNMVDRVLKTWENRQGNK
jgi:hypothetical protein